MGSRSRGRAGRPPEILYHATTADRVAEAARTGCLEGRGRRPLMLSEREAAAWKLAHRLSGPPEVVVVDAQRARRGGMRFRRGPDRHYLSDPIPRPFLLSLEPGFGRQVSAGGFLVRPGPAGPEVALVRCRRRSSRTWEVAKGKVEPGERPEETAARELAEELGLETSVRVIEPLGEARYVFRTPEGEPRLKVLHLFLLEAAEHDPRFRPAAREGIEEVRWFPVREAARRVGQPSLWPVMRRLVRRLGEPQGLTARPGRANRAGGSSP